MDLENLLNKLEKYRVGSTDRSFGTLTDSYENDYINLRCVEHSNKWINNTSLIKQWSIIVNIKKTFTLLKSYKNLEKKIDIKVTPVRKGRNKGAYGIRIYGMKSAPDILIIRGLLDYIFINQ